MTDTEAERRRTLQRLGNRWPNGWTRALADEYHRALDDLPPRILDEAISIAVRDRTVIPAPPQLRETVEVLEAAEQAKRRRTTTAGDGQGCPECRRTHPPGRHEHWIGDGKLICCTVHNIMWQGTTHNPDTTDNGDPLTPTEWRTRAATGEFGQVLARVAAFGGGPASIGRALAGEHELAHEIAEAARAHGQAIHRDAA